VLPLMVVTLYLVMPPRRWPQIFVGGVEKKEKKFNWDIALCDR